tara:strand:+ start:471 stop:1967 length:1497 start_codon:yes stop_codon:yes gene_type:complete
MKDKKEKFFWADQIADKIIKEKKKNIYICASGITPSGTIHMGNFREVITTDLVVKSLKDKGKKVKFIYSWDDYDRLRKVPVNIPKEFKKYIGIPISDFPSPFDKKLDYARYYEKQFENDLKSLGIKPKFVRQNLMYKERKYISLIKTAIKKRKEIMEILNKYRKEPLEKDWMPVEVYCEKCNKDFTKILSVKDYVIEYKCNCGFKNKIDFRKKGNLKLKWRIDWPMRWKYEKVNFEPGGIDHSSPGGSYDTAKEISKMVFNYSPPIYTFYDWIRIKGGTEFSSSSGNVISLKEGLEIYEPEVLRYLFVSTRPNKGFQISFDNDVIKIYDDFDSLENKYYEGLANQQEKRIYELSQIKLSQAKPKRISFRHLITLAQTGKIGKLKGTEKARAKKVENWLEKYASDDMKFEIQDKVNVNLTEKQKQVLIALKESLAVKDFNEDELFNEFYNICKAVGIEGKEFFETAYNIIINKNKGPRLASLILSIGKEKIIKLLNQIK